MMKRSTTLSFLLAAAVAATIPFSVSVRADAPADLKAAQDESKKPKPDAALIDTKLGAAIAAPAELSAELYRQARTLQEQRRVAAIADKTPPQKRQLLNQAFAEIAAEIGRQYLGDESDAAKRFDVYRVQHAIANDITDSMRAKALEADVVKAVLADVDQRYLASADVAAENKEAAVKQLLVFAGVVKDAAKKRELTLAAYDRYVALGSVKEKNVFLDVARLRAAGGEIDAASKAYQRLIDDAGVTAAIKTTARVERMRLYAGKAMWKEAKADAEVLSKQALADFSEAGIAPLPAIELKRQSLRVIFANGGLDPASLSVSTDELCHEALIAVNITAEEKSTVLTDIFQERATELAGRYQWDAALGWAKAAYNIAPNSKVAGTVTLVQQILANRSRKALGKDDFDLSRNPKDIEAAAAFYARQSGSKKAAPVAAAPTAPGAPVVPAKPQPPILLAANLSNDDQFPRQLAGVSVPLADAFKYGVQRTAAQNGDPLTRALALAILEDNDKAIEIVKNAINELGLESPKLSSLINFAARLVRSKFESVSLANAFLESQADGPAGKDGKLGTADDKPNPLAAGKE